MHSHIGLLQGIYQVHIHHQVLLAQHMAGTEAFEGNGDLKYSLFGIKAEFELAMGFSYHIFSRIAKRFDLQNRHHFGQLYNCAVYIHNAFAHHEGRSGGQTIKKT